MGATLLVINDDFDTEKEYGHINDFILESIIEVAKKLSLNCLSYVLIYENTFFNSAQMEEIEKELTKLENYFQQNEINEVFMKIREAIEFAKADPPLYLLFEGD